jgi:hypothetical protein
VSEQRRDDARYTLELAVDVRKLELQLFWQRSLFFWGFVAAAFVALTASYGKHPKLALLISSFGVVCSFAWTLSNRGSRYWHEHWEQKVQQLDAVAGELFEPGGKPLAKGWWLRARRYSVGKLAIALSDFVTLLWVVILGYQVAVETHRPLCVPGSDSLALLTVLATIVYVVLLLYAGRSSTNREGTTAPNLEQKGIT